MIRMINFLIIFSLLSACSPHPGAGKWSSVADNEWGIKEINLLFEGKAEFVSSKKDIAVWHCFWGGESNTIASLNCVPSTDTERRETFKFVVQGEQRGELSQHGKRIGNFTRQPYE